MSYSLSGINLEQNLLTDNDSNLENGAVERIILKCNHTNLLGDLNYITYTDREWIF